MSAREIALFPTRHPVWTISFTLVLTLVFISRIVDPFTGEVHLHIDPSFDAILPDGDKSRDYYDWVSEEFGSDQSVILGLVMDDVFTLENLRAIKRVSDRLEEAGRSRRQPRHGERYPQRE